MKAPSIYNFITEQESAFQTDEISVGSNWNWSFKTHVQLIFHLKNGVFFTGANDYLRAFKNIMEPILNLAYWTEDIEVKDVVFFIESENGRELSFLIKKYHDEVYSRKHNLDEMFDEITENDLDYGGVLVLKAKGRPEVPALASIAFADQTNLLGGPIGFKMSFSPDKLRDMSKLGWGKEENGATITIEDLILLADYDKDPSGMVYGKKNKTTGKNLDVFIVKGSLPEGYLKDNDEMEKYVYQNQVVAFYTDKESKKQGVILYRRKGDDSTLKFHTCKKIHNRGLGRGEGEALVHPQIWTNFLTIHKTAMLEAGSKSLLQTSDANFTNRNKIQDMENLEVVNTEKDTRIDLIPTINPNNIQLYSNDINQWYDHAQLAGSAFDPIMGVQPQSGTTFRGQERVVQQGRGLHDRRRGQRAKFLEEIYRDWIIPDMVREITYGKKFLATLTADEMGWVSDQLAENYANRKQIDDILDLKEPQDRELLKHDFLTKFRKKGNKHLIEILKKEFEGVEVKLGISVSGKQKDLAGLSDKVLSIFQFIFQNPQAFQQAMQIPGLAKSFQNILEFSGVNQTDFATFASQTPQPLAQPTQQTAQPSPLQLTAPVA